MDELDTEKAIRMSQSSASRNWATNGGLRSGGPHLWSDDAPLVVSR